MPTAKAIGEPRSPIQTAPIKSEENAFLIAERSFEAKGTERKKVRLEFYVKEADQGKGPYWIIETVNNGSPRRIVTGVFRAVASIFMVKDEEWFQGYVDGM